MSARDNSPGPEDFGAELGLSSALADQLRVAAETEAAAPSFDLVADISAAVAEEKGLLADLRAWPTWARLVTATGAIGLLSVVMFLLMPRPDLAAYPMPRMAFALAGLSGTAIVALSLGLRSLFARRTPTWAAITALAATVAVPTLLIAMPEAHTPYAAANPHAHALIPRATECFIFGIIVAVPVFLLMWLLERDRMRSLRRALLAAAATGLAGNLALQIHCPINSRAHLALGHLTVIVASLAIWAVITRLAHRSGARR